jgi:NADPH2:quinone reductase
MKTLILDAPGNSLQMKDAEIPKTVPGFIRVQNKCFGINYGDTLINRIPVFARALFRVSKLFGAKTLPGPHPLVFPWVPGFEVAGIVDETSDTSFPVGTRVIAFPEGGGYAEYVCVPAERVVRIPGDISYDTALGVGLQGITAYDVLYRTANLQRGESVLISAAAGGVGSLAIQLARLAGASMVIGATSSAEKMSVIEKLGATAINYAQPHWIQQVLDITNARGVDVALESAGGKQFHEALKATRDGGRLVSYGMANIEAGLQKITVMNLKMRGLTLATYKDNWLEHTTQDTWSLLMRLVQSNQLTPIIGQHYSFQATEINRAWEEYSKRITYGKSLVFV